MSWRERAACRGTDPEVFYPLPGDSGAYDDARTCCAGCSARADCLEEAMAGEGDLAPGGRHGMWGGFTPRERHALSEACRQARA